MEWNFNKKKRKLTSHVHAANVRGRASASEKFDPVARRVGRNGQTAFRKGQYICIPALDFLIRNERDEDHEGLYPHVPLCDQCN